MPSAEPNANNPPTQHPPWIHHILPFVGWLFAMQMLGDPSGPAYTGRVLIGLALLLILRPWRWYDSPITLLQNRDHLIASLATGIIVAAFWVLPEWPGWPDAWHNAYATFAMQMPWEHTPIEHTPIYTGAWILPRLLGAVIVIAVIEEFFWRGWMYRWIQTDDFANVDPGHLDTRALLVSAAFFSMVHTRWIAAFACGLLYAWLYIRTRNIWAAVLAHAVTNALLAAVVLKTGQHGFWA